MSSHLTEEQQGIVAHREGHAMVSAVPGSGKTTTMSHYVQALVNDGLNPRHLLVLMFNKSTRMDFKDKLDRLGVPGALDNDFPVFTYHGMAYRLGTFFVKKGLMPKYELETRDSKLKYAASIALRKVYPTREFNSRKKELIDNFLSFVDYHKSVFLSEKESFNALGFTEKDKALLNAFSVFEQDRKRKNIFYFTDLLRETVNVLMTNEHALSLVANKKDRIIVDEFQDTNPVQYEMVKRLAGTRGQLMAVGDVDQTLYEWCGADPEFMLHETAKDFQPLTHYPLSYTFRYGPDLAAASTSLIKNNKGRFDQDCVAFRNDQAMNLNAHAISAEMEPDLVYRMVRDATDPNQESPLRFEDIAVICRVYGAAGGIEMEMLKNGIPCLIPKESSILNSREMHVVMAISRLLGCFEMGDAKEGWRLARQHYGQDINELTSNSKLNMLGGDNREAIIRDFIERNDGDLPLDRFMSSHPIADDLRRERPYTKRILADEPMHMSMTLSGNGRSQAKSFFKKLTSVISNLELREQLKSRCMTEMDEEVSERRLEAILGYVKFHDMERDDFVRDIERLREQQENTKDVKDGILITSVHKAKGLEWPMVIMPTLEEGLFPFEPKTGLTAELMESERRLFYVAMTRTKDTLHLVGPSMDRQYEDLMSGKAVAPAKESDEGASTFLFELGMKEGAFSFHRHRTQPAGPAMRPPGVQNLFPGGDSRTINTGGL